MKNLLKVISLIAVVFLVSIFIPNNDLTSVMSKLSLNTTGAMGAMGGASGLGDRSGMAGASGIGGDAQTGSPAPAAYAKNIKKIPPEIVEYLKNSKDYGLSYTLNKKFVIVYVLQSDAPYSKAFLKQLTNMAGDMSIMKNFPFEITGKNERKTADDNAFYDLCHYFCIVNPTRSEIYSLDKYGDSEAANLKKTFEDLKNW